MKLVPDGGKSHSCDNPKFVELSVERMPNGSRAPLYGWPCRPMTHFQDEGISFETEFRRKEG
jgi:hypothetical protein